MLTMESFYHLSIKPRGVPLVFRKKGKSFKENLSTMRAKISSFFKVQDGFEAEQREVFNGLHPIGMHPFCLMTTIRADLHLKLGL